MRFGLKVAALAAVCCIAGCGGGGGSSTPPPPTYTVGGTISGLTGSGLVLQINGAGNFSVAPNATSFTFAAQLTSGSPYNVSVLTNPSGPTQLCTVSGGLGNVGSANVTSIGVNCVNAFTIGGTVSGLAGVGLVLRNNGADQLAISANGPFTFAAPLVTSSTYNVAVFATPANQNCGVASGIGTVASANVTSVAVTCTVNGFTIGALNDPLVLQQWHLKNTGQNAFADGVGIAGIDINVDPVYSNFGFTGTGVTVAVVDSGLEIAHEDLAANVVPGGSWNFNNSTTDPTNTVDTEGDHGTSVSGLIAMAMGNSKGGIGVAPKARLKGFNFLSMTAQTEQAFLDSIGASNSSPKSSDVFIFNQSFGIETNTPVLVDPVDEAQYVSGITSLRGGKGAIYVKAAGNGFTDIALVDCTGSGLTCENANFDPANTLPYQIVVGAVNADGIKASYSTAGSAIWVSAPGGEFGMNSSVSGRTGVFVEPAMVTTDQSGCVKGISRSGATTSSFNKGVAPNGDVFNLLCNYTNGMNGTSSATPVTAGVIALMLEANPALTWRDVKHILASTARKIDPTGGAVNGPLAGYVAEPGWTTNNAPASQFSPIPFNYHNWYGFGMVNAQAAVNMARTYAVNLGTFTNTGFISSGALSLAIPDHSATGVISTIPVPAGAVQVIEAVQVRVSLTHPFLGDLGIEVISPAGTRSVVKNIEDGYADADDLINQVFLSNAFYGENPVGTWTIKVVDGFTDDMGTLTNWAIRVYGH
jgi:subtilisin-like proprotein convertase family protein/subtilisin family serine protease